MSNNCRYLEWLYVVCATCLVERSVHSALRICAANVYMKVRLLVHKLLTTISISRRGGVSQQPIYIPKVAKEYNGVDSV
jgi:hypothetical protein